MKKLLLVLSIIIVSCDAARQPEELNCDYKGGVILSRISFGKFGGVFYSIKYNGEIISPVKAFDIDTNYQTGDTINKPCIK